jgi:uncharacterized phage protein gp47/JayE
MPRNIRSPQDIYDTIERRISDDVYGVTNFTPNSFNAALLSSQSRELHELEIRIIASILAGSVDYAGKELTENDLRQLNIDGVSAEQINEYMEDKHLDLLASNVSISRQEPTYATTTLKFEVADDTISIPDGFPVSTGQSDDNTYLVDVTGEAISDDGTLLFTNQSADPVENNGDYFVTVDAVAADTGPDYNVSAGVIDTLPQPTPGVISVTNTEAASGGFPLEPNESLRERVRNAIFSNSNGGTRSGLSGSIQSEVEEVVDINIDEYTKKQPPYADVIISGGSKSELLDLIDEFKPLGVLHNLLRPTENNLLIEIDVIGSVTSSALKETVSEVVGQYEIGENIYWSDLVTELSTRYDDIQSIGSLNMYVDEVALETQNYESGTDEYSLIQGPIGSIRDVEYIVTQDRLNNGFKLPYEPDTSNPVTVQGKIDGVVQDISSSNYAFTQSNGEWFLDLDISPPTQSRIILDYDSVSTGITDVYVAPWDVDGESEQRQTQLSASDYNIVTDNNGRTTGIDISPYSGQIEDDQRITIEYNAHTSINNDFIASGSDIANSETTIINLV